jgi:replicative DNA helicase
MIYSYELEQHLLAGLIKYPDKYSEIAPFIGGKDFCKINSSVNSTIYSILSKSLNAGEVLDETLLAERIKSLNISFEDNVDIVQYIKHLGLKKISKEGVTTAAKELKKFTIRREIYFACNNVAKKMKSMSPEMSYKDIISQADKIYNDQLNFYEAGAKHPEDIYDSMQEFIDIRGQNSEKYSESGFLAPHMPMVNDLYGSLLKPGNITVVVARTGVGKTQFCMDFCTKVSKEYDVPVLHFDNGEMSKEELMLRQCSALSGVPLYYLETGKYMHVEGERGEEMRSAVDGLWKKIKNNKLNYYYYNVGGLSVDEMVNALRRFYYAKVGRGNPLIFNFDYIKTASEKNKDNSTSHWERVGDMVTKFKTIIQSEIVDSEGPLISMFTSVQSNRTGITTNRRAENVIDDESIVSLSDQITQYCSHLFLLRRKTNDEVMGEPANFGSHKLICLKHRHLGPSVARALNLVERSETGAKQQNYINLNLDNFVVEEKGDLQDMEDYISNGADPIQDGFANLGEREESLFPSDE